MDENGNNIKKPEALKHTRVTRQKQYVIDCMVQATFYGADYQENFDDTHAMSYFCRAFNITAYGASKQENRIKGRYQEYKDVEGKEAYFRRILESTWPGFSTEEPRMDALLEQYPAVDIFKSGENAQASFETTPTEGAQFPVEVIPVILLIIGAILLLKWNPVLVILLAIIGEIVYYQVKKGNRLRLSGQTSSVRKIVLGVLGIFFTFLVIVGLKAALVDDSESFIMIIVYGILAALCFRGAVK